MSKAFFPSLAMPALAVTAQSYNGGYCPNGTFGMMGRVYGPSSWMGSWFGFGTFGAIISLIFWILIIVAMIYLIRRLAHGGHQDVSEDEASEVLKKRYARGEISREEYDKMKKELDKM